MKFAAAAAAVALFSTLATSAPAAVPDSVYDRSSNDTNDGPDGNPDQGYGSYCQKPGAYQCMPTSNEYTTSVAVCNVLNVLVEHAPCGAGTVCKKRLVGDASIYCVPPEYEFCKGVDAPGINGTFAVFGRSNGTITC